MFTFSACLPKAPFPCSLILEKVIIPSQHFRTWIEELCPPSRGKCSYEFGLSLLVGSYLAGPIEIATSIFFSFWVEIVLQQERWWLGNKLATNLEFEILAPLMTDAYVID